METTAEPSSLPLRGVRVLDFTWVWAGPYATMLLAMLGAEVIKIEGPNSLDLGRRAIVWPAAEPEPLEIPINQGASFNAINMSKLGVTVDLQKARGVDLVKRLVTVSDVVVDNMRAGSMERLGLGYQALREVNAGIIVLSSTGRGSQGPERDYAGYATIHCAIGGSAHITGYADQPPSTTTGDVDLMNATASAFAVVAALFHRAQTGEGQFIDFSQCEGVTSLIGEVLLDYEMNGRSPGRDGNRDELLAPHNVYQCWGVDRWVALAVETDEEFAALARVMGRPEMADDPRFADGASRKRNEADLDTMIAEWTRPRDRGHVVEMLCEVGLAAAPSRDAEDLIRDPHLRERGAFVEVDHPEVGIREFVGAPWRMSDCEPPVRHAPLLGEHNDYVFGELVGVSDAELAQLRREGVIT
jgi:benzylsuccinate CoA-transferase BbsF subunit